MLESCITVGNESLINAAKECKVNVNKIGIAEYTVSVDRTWQKRGYGSLNDVVTLQPYLVLTITLLITMCFQKRLSFPVMA